MQLAGRKQKEVVTLQNAASHLSSPAPLCDRRTDRWLGWHQVTNYWLVWTAGLWSRSICLCSADTRHVSTLGCSNSHLSSCSLAHLLSSFCSARSHVHTTQRSQEKAPASSTWTPSTAANSTSRQLGPRDSISYYSEIIPFAVVKK